MKKKSFFILFFFISAIAFAQKEIPAFGKVDKADLEMKDCDFDKGAEAVKLIDWGNTYYDRGTVGRSLFKTIFQRRTRIKILKEKGLYLANVRIPYYSYNDDEKIVTLSAYIYNIDAVGKIKTTNIKRSSFYPKKINAEYSEMIIAFPEVKVGSIIEYKYTMERETMGQLKDWFFQERIPVRYSEYQFTVPQIFRFSVQPSVIDKIEETKEVTDEILSADNGLIKTKSLKNNYIMRNLPGIKDEPFMGAAKDYMQRLQFQLKQIDYGDGDIADLRFKWSDVISELKEDENFGEQLEKSILTTEPFIAAANTITNAETRMLFIYNQIRRTINWNGKDDIYADNGIEKTWETKNGNTADINLLFIKLLNDAGVKAIPILFSTREHGLATPYYPFVNQFNTVMAYVTVNNVVYVIDATDKISNYKLVPAKIVNTKGLILSGEDGVWKDITADNYKYKVLTAVHGVVDTAGVMKGDGVIKNSDYARKERCENWLKNTEEFKEEYFRVPYPFLKIDNITVHNAYADSLPLEQKVNFTMPLSNSGSYKYFTVNLFSGLDKNPFVADDRIADIDFGFQQQYNIYGNFFIPQNYVFDALPVNISMIMPDTSILFNRSIQAEENILNVRISVEFKKSFYPASNYPVFKEFYKKLFDKLNEPILIKKKEAL